MTDNNTDIRIQDLEHNGAVSSICRLVADAGGRALIVGGAVRDALLGFTPKDVDIEVYGIPANQLPDLLRLEFELDLVGAAFGVIKVKHLDIDVSLPRRESKTGLGHKGFEIMSDPRMTPIEAARRRDFTINAMAYDPLSGEIIDPFCGRDDLANRILRHTSDAFTEDPLRVLRGMQFVARFELNVAPETTALCRQLKCDELAEERIFEEWTKLILKGVRPSLGLRFLRDCDWVRYFPELAALIGCEQDPGWHPEGDVWEHTLHCMDAFAGERTGDRWEDLVVGLAVLCHDFGKPETTQLHNGRIRSLAHEPAGAEPTKRFLQRMTKNNDLVKDVVPLVKAHLKPVQLFDDQAGDGAIRRLANRVGRIDRLVRVARADQLGRPPKKMDVFPAGDWLLEKAVALEVADSAPEPIVMGRHLIELGLKPGPHFGQILDKCYEAQMDGMISAEEDGLEYAREVLQKGYVSQMHTGKREN